MSIVLSKRQEVQFLFNFFKIRPFSSWTEIHSKAWITTNLFTNFYPLRLSECIKLQVVMTLATDFSHLYVCSKTTNLTLLRTQILNSGKQVPLTGFPLKLSGVFQSCTTPEIRLFIVVRPNKAFWRLRIGKCTILAFLSFRLVG